MMNLLLAASPDDEQMVAIVCGIFGFIFFILFLAVLSKFFEMAKDLKSISKDISSILSVVKNNGSGQSDE